jgi:hypothetical protein
MGPVIGEVNAGASIVKAMLVTDASMHCLSTPVACRAKPPCRVGVKLRMLTFTAGPADGAGANHAERPGESHCGRP